jgi:hypothetical protein
MSRTVLLGVCALLEILLCLMLVAPVFVDTKSLASAVRDLAETNTADNTARYRHEAADADRVALRTRSEVGAAALANGLLLMGVAKRLPRRHRGRPKAATQPLQVDT